MPVFLLGTTIVPRSAQFGFQKFSSASLLVIVVVDIFAFCTFQLVTVLSVAGCTHCHLIEANSLSVIRESLEFVILFVQHSFCRQAFS